MATIASTKISKPSPIVEDEQGQLRARQGISREVVSELSKIKEEPDWMAEKRLRSLEIFERKPVPTWGVDLSGPLQPNLMVEVGNGASVDRAGIIVARACRVSQSAISCRQR